MSSILVIDDTDSIRHFLHRALVIGGFETTTAATGADGLALSLNRHYDLILCDLKLPDVSGLDVLRQLRRSGNTTPFIILTRYPDPASAFLAGTHGASNYIYGILTAEDIQSAVTECLRHQISMSREVLVGDALGLRLRDATSVSVDARLARIVAIIEERPHIPAKQLGDEVGLSESRLRFLFKQTFGVTLSKCVREARLRLAARLLVTTDLRIGTIAGRVGANDIHYFGRQFRARFDESPVVFRRRSRPKNLNMRSRRSH